VSGLITKYDSASTWKLHAKIVDHTNRLSHLRRMMRESLIRAGLVGAIERPQTAGPNKFPLVNTGRAISGGIVESRLPDGRLVVSRPEWPTMDVRGLLK
jgi:hypothetical protein